MLALVDFLPDLFALVLRRFGGEESAIVGEEGLFGTPERVCMDPSIRGVGEARARADLSVAEVVVDRLWWFCFG